MCASLFLVYEGLSQLGVFDWASAKAARAKAMVDEIKNVWISSSDSLAEWSETITSTYQLVASVIEPWRIRVYLGILILFYLLWKELSDPAIVSPASSAAGTPPPGSPHDSPTPSPQADAQSLALQAVADALQQQGATLVQMAEGQVAIQDRLADHMGERRTAQLLQ